MEVIAQTDTAQYQSTYTKAWQHTPYGFRTDLQHNIRNFSISSIRMLAYTSNVLTQAIEQYTVSDRLATRTDHTGRKHGVIARILRLLGRTSIVTTWDAMQASMLTKTVDLPSFGSRMMKARANCRRWMPAPSCSGFA